MKKYIVPEIEIEEVSSEDIMSTSSVNGNAANSVFSITSPGSLNAENDGKGGLNVSGNVNDMLS